MLLASQIDLSLVGGTASSLDLDNKYIQGLKRQLKEWGEKDKSNFLGWAAKVYSQEVAGLVELILFVENDNIH